MNDKTDYLEQARKMIHYSFSAIWDHFGMDEILELQNFLDTCSDDFMIDEFEKFVRAKVRAKVRTKLGHSGPNHHE